MTEHFTSEEIDKFDATRFAYFMQYSCAGRPDEVAGLLAMTIMPHVEGLPANMTQFGAQKQCADAIKKAAEHADDVSLLNGIGTIAVMLSEQAVDEGQRRYWTGVMEVAAVTLAEIELAEPEPPKPAPIPSSALPDGWGWNPALFTNPENAKLADALLQSMMTRSHCTKRFHFRCDH